MEEIGLFENNNEVYTNKKIKETQKLKLKANKEYEMAIRMKNPEQIKNKTWPIQKIVFTNIIKDYEINTTEHKLKSYQL